MFLGVLHEISPPQSGNYNKAPKKLKKFLVGPSFFCISIPQMRKNRLLFCIESIKIQVSNFAARGSAQQDCDFRHKIF